MTCNALGFGKRHDGSDDANQHSNYICHFSKKNKACFLESIKMKMNFQNKSLKLTSVALPLEKSKGELALSATFVQSLCEDDSE